MGLVSAGGKNQTRNQRTEQLSCPGEMAEGNPSDAFSLGYAVFSCGWLRETKSLKLVSSELTEFFKPVLNSG